MEFLHDLEYRGPLVVRRTDSKSPAHDLAFARDFLKKL
jgi:hypothetical protein